MTAGVAFWVGVVAGATQMAATYHVGLALAARRRERRLSRSWLADIDTDLGWPDPATARRQHPSAPAAGDGGGVVVPLRRSSGA